MLILLSPAKNLDYKTAVPVAEHSQLALAEDAQALAQVCKTLAPADLSQLMGISDKLAILNAERFNDFAMPFDEDNARQAIYAFNGDVYTGLDAYSLNADDVAFAQGHLRILSGLYGVLKPLDLMQPYRLEMGTSLATERGKNLYEFWGNKITDELNDLNSEVVVNLASNEYFSAVKTQNLTGRLITPVFKDEKNGKVKIISFYAKKARGLMARWIIEHRITDTAALSGFDVAGYRFAPEQSDDSTLTFIRLEKDRA